MQEEEGKWLVEVLGNCLVNIQLYGYGNWIAIARGGRGVQYT